MANQYTSIQTGGLSDNTVKAAYDLAIGLVLRERPMYRAFVPFKTPQRPSMPGSSIILNKYDWFDDTAVTAAKTPLNEEQDVDSTKLPPTIPVTLTFNEYGFAVTKTKLLKMESFADVDQYAATAVANHMADTLDELVQDVMVTGTQKILADAVGAEGSLAAANTLGAAELRKAKTKLQANHVWGYDGGLYMAGIHPHVLHDLREETGSGSWRLPNEYGTDQSKIWSGEIGAFEGFRFVENTRSRRTQTGSGSSQTNSVYRTFVLGQEAIVEGVLEEPGFRIGPVTDKLGRFSTAAWYGCLGWTVYRDEAIIQLLSGSSVATL